MPVDLSEDIRSVSELKRQTREILDQIHRTGRPVVLTVNGKADAVLMEAKTYEKHLKASNLARMVAAASSGVSIGTVAEHSGHQARTACLRRLMICTRCVSMVIFFAFSSSGFSPWERAPLGSTQSNASRPVEAKCLWQTAKKEPLAP